MTGANDKAKYAYDGLDRTIHEKARLGILTSLISQPNGLSFGEIKQLCDLTDGNLSRHIKVLKDAELIRVEKGYEGNRPSTYCFVTAKGTKAFLDYISVLEQVIEDAQLEQGQDPSGVLS